MIFDKWIKAGFIAAGLIFSASVAGAATINFAVDRSWTTGTNSYTNGDGSHTITVDGVRVNRSGAITNTDDFYTASWDSASGNYGGIGVYACNRTTRSGYCIDNTHTIDGSGPDEFALLDFGGLEVEITSATFTYWDRRDTFAFGVYDTTVLPATALIYEENLDDGNSNPYTHYFDAGQVVGSIIGFGADSWRDDFKLQSITYEVVGNVPLPAGLALMLTGLGGFGLMRKTKRRAS